MNFIIRALSFHQHQKAKYVSTLEVPCCFPFITTSQEVLISHILTSVIPFACCCISYKWDHTVYAVIVSASFCLALCLRLISISAYFFFLKVTIILFFFCFTNSFTIYIGSNSKCSLIFTLRDSLLLAL